MSQEPPQCPYRRGWQARQQYGPAEQGQYLQPLRQPYEQRQYAPQQRQQLPPPPPNGHGKPPKRSPHQHQHDNRYSEVIGGMTFVTALTKDHKGAAEARCPGEPGDHAQLRAHGALVDYPRRKNSEANGRHIGWFFLGVKEGCK